MYKKLVAYQLKRKWTPYKYILDEDLIINETVLPSQSHTIFLLYTSRIPPTHLNETVLQKT